MDNLEKELLKELNRFNQIGYNSQNLKEQMIGGVGNGSGFMDKAGESERLKKFEARQVEMSEQEEPEVDPVDTEETPLPGGFDEFEIGADETTEPAADAPLTPPTPEADPSALVPADGEEIPVADENTTEVDVTDIVTKQEGIEKNSGETNQKLDTLMDMLGNMEDKLSGMDTLMSQIEDIEQKIEKFRPKTSEEKQELRKYDSGPYTQSLENFWDDSQEKFEEQGKQEYILTPEEVDNFSDTEIKKTFETDGM
jgi:hypothetical protein